MADDVHRFELRARTTEELRSFLDGSDVDLGCRPTARRSSGEVVVDVYTTVPRMNALQASRSAAGVTAKVVENATEVGRARQAEVGSGNRLLGRQTFRGLGIKE